MTSPRWAAPAAAAAVVALIVGGAVAAGTGGPGHQGRAGAGALSSTTPSVERHGSSLWWPSSAPVPAPASVSVWATMWTSVGQSADASPPSLAAEPTLPEAIDPVVARLSGWDVAPTSCVVLVKGVTPEEAVRRLGGNPGRHIAADSFDFSGDRSATAVGVMAGWTVLDEDNGWSCSEAESLAALTKGGATAVTAYWSETADTTLSLAINGRLVTSWDLTDGASDGTQPRRLDALKAKVSADVAAYHDNSAMMAVAAGVTGVELPADWRGSWTVWLPAG